MFLYCQNSYYFTFTVFTVGTDTVFTFLTLLAEIGGGVCLATLALSNGTGGLCLVFNDTVLMVSCCVFFGVLGLIFYDLSLDIFV
jgi:hypothetical protein